MVVILVYLVEYLEIRVDIRFVALVTSYCDGLVTQPMVLFSAKPDIL